MPKIVDADQYRKDLLDKSFKLFAQKGYASLTTRQLAQELGVSTGTLYHYFPNKAALFEQLIEEMCQRDVLMARVEIEKAHTLTEKLKVLGKFIENNESRCIQTLFIWIDYCQHLDREELIASKIFTKVSERYQQAVINLFGIQDPQIAWLINNLIHGVMLERLWGNQKISFSEQLTLIGKILTVYLS